MICTTATLAAMATADGAVCFHVFKATAFIFVRGNFQNTALSRAIRAMGSNPGFINIGQFAPLLLTQKVSGRTIRNPFPHLRISQPEPSGTSLSDTINQI